MSSIGSTSAPSGDSGNGGVQSPEQAAAAFLATAASTTLKTGSSTGDARVSAAFALGWQIAELYRPSVTRRAAPASQDDLPGLGELSESDHTRLGFSQLGAGLTKLSPTARAAGLTLPVIDELNKALATAVNPGDRGDALRGFHVDLLTTLTAADVRVGKAYGLGRALADTCNKPADLGSLRLELGHYRVETLRAWLEDLETALPAHAGQTISGSLASWSAWAAGLPDDFDARSVLRRLREQGRLWRSVLSGEKAATDMLQIDDYVLAATTMLRRTGKLARVFLFRHVLLASGVIALFGGGIALMFVDQSHTAAIVAGVSGVVASLGLSWKGIGGSLGKAFGKLEQPLWNASLDQRVTAAITLAPSEGTNANFRDQEPPEPTSTTQSPPPG